MGEVRRKKKHLAIQRKLAKREKVRKLVQKLSTADPKEQEKIIEKIRRVSPYHPIPNKH
jgi:hypothetical protein